MTLPRIVATAIVSVLFLLGCAAPAPRLVDVAPGVHEMTLRSGFVPVKGDELRLRVEEEAARYCRTNGRAYAVLDTRAFDPEPPDVSSAVTRFRCV